MKTLSRELVRLLPIAGVAGLILVPDSSSSVVLFSIGITLALVGLSHIIRKLLFPYIDMEVFAKKALESPAGAATVFASITVVMGVIIYASTNLLH